MAINTKKTLFIVMIVAAFTTAFLIFHLNATSNDTIPSSTRKTHNFNMLSKTLSTNQGPPRRLEAFHSNGYDEVQILNQSSSSHGRKLSLIDELSQIFHSKMSEVTTKKTELKPVCHNPDVIANSCDDKKCLQMKFPSELRERVRQIVEPTKLQMSNQLEEILDSMASKVKGDSKFMILSGTSSNHFLETQALIRNLHENIYPYFKNFILVIYNLGLKPEERRHMVSFCKCQVIDFPFDQFPVFVSRMLCYAWKPLIVRAHINQADIVMWIDASIRFDSDPSKFEALLRRTQKRSIQIAQSKAVSPFRTYRSMYHFFGDEPCMYLNMGQVQSGIDMFVNEQFVKKAVLDPWAMCAVTQSCMCPLDKPIKSCAETHKMTAKWENNEGPIVYGLCHRYDQSSLSIILHKLYQDVFSWVTFDVKKYIYIKRKDQLRYFESFA